nr:E3 ubiquitin-protein ligase TRIM56-like [Lytechinus pictus]
MAEQGEDPLKSSQNLICPLCLEMFKDATLLTCGHTFCRICLENYDETQREVADMACPLCRVTTKLDKERVAGLPANVTVNSLVDDCRSAGESHKSPDDVTKCTACEFGKDAVSFCIACSYYMCEGCDEGHGQLMKTFFKGHQVVSLDDVKEKDISIDELSNKCSIHKRDDKDLFCKDCKIFICYKCTIVSHRDHVIKNQPDVVNELKNTVDRLIKLSDSTIASLKENIGFIEDKKTGVQETTKKLRADVTEAVHVKSIQLQENERMLLEQVHALQERCDGDIDTLKENAVHRIQNISRSLALVKDGIKTRHLEMERLTAHSLVCEELEASLGEASDETSAKDILESVEEVKFLPTDNMHEEVGQFSIPTCRIINKIEFPKHIQGMVKNNIKSVVIAQYGGQSVIKINSNGDKQDMQKLPSMFYYDIAFQSRSKMVVSSNSYYEIHVHAKDGSRLATIEVPRGGDYPKVSIGPSDEILVANKSSQVFIYESSGQTLTHTIPTPNLPKQAFATMSGAIVTSSCDANPSVVQLYDKDGNAGTSLRALQGEYLYPAVDSKDRIFIARVKKGTLLFTLYELEGLDLRKRAQFEELKISPGSNACYLVCLSRGMLAFACGCWLYFVKVPYIYSTY